MFAISSVMRSAASAVVTATAGVTLGSSHQARVCNAFNVPRKSRGVAANDVSVRVASSQDSDGLRPWGGVRMTQRRPRFAVATSAKTTRAPRTASNSNRSAFSSAMCSLACGPANRSVNGSGLPAARKRVGGTAKCYDGLQMRPLIALYPRAARSPILQ